MAMTLMQETKPYTVSNSIINDAKKLQARAQQDGYLYLKNLLPKEKVLAVRNEILKITKNNGLLKPDTNMMDGIANPEIKYVEGSCPQWREYYMAIQRCRAFHELAHSPQIVSVFEKLFGEKVLVHPRNISRTIYPQLNKYTTPPHQDYIYIKGTSNTWTLWLSLGDCPSELGGLAIAPGTHKLGLLDVRKADGAGGKECFNFDQEEWVCNDISCGDVLMFHSYTIHQGRDNLTEDRIRFSCDYRYQPMSELVHHSSLLPHYNLEPWETVYKTWPSDDTLAYYWKNSPLNIEADEAPLAKAK